MLFLVLSQVFQYKGKILLVDVEDTVLINCNGQVVVEYPNKHIRGIVEIPNYPSCTYLAVQNRDGLEYQITELESTLESEFVKEELIVDLPNDFDEHESITATCYSRQAINKYIFVGVEDGRMHFNCNFEYLTEGKESKANTDNYIFDRVGITLTKQCQRFDKSEIIGCDVVQYDSADERKVYFFYLD